MDTLCVEFHNEVEIMRSLQKPRKFSVYGDDGKLYTFLAKPKDDLRKDARLMDFNTMINKLLAKNSEARRRQLRKPRPVTDQHTAHQHTQ